jgi:serine phosphatase RsbU (regulator of sigma subunit)
MMSALPDEPGFRMDALRVPSALHGANGVWYDAFRLSDGRIAITVGDIFGNDHADRPITPELQTQMRTVAMARPEPHQVLSAIDQFLRAKHPDILVAAIIGVLDPEARTFSYATAGHHTPLLVHASGDVVEDDNVGLLLGLLHFEEPTTSMISLPPDSVLMLYTNGLLKAKRDLDQSRRDLLNTLRDPLVRTHKQPAQHVYERMCTPLVPDDVAIITVHTISPRV